MANKKRLDTKKPYSRCVGSKKGHFYQNGNYFDRSGAYTSSAPESFVRGVKKVAEADATSMNSAVSNAKEAAKEAAKNLAGFTGNGGAELTDEMREAEKENQQALAAEQVST